MQNNIPKTYIVIPARLASTRLPKKLLLNATGKPLIQYPYETAQKSRMAANVFVACDDQSIFDVVESFGGTAILTDPNAKSGTDRVAEVAAQLTDAEIIVNLQGDEPDLSSESIDQLIQILVEHPNAEMATLATPIYQKELLDDPACVKVVFDKRGKALYFSRSMIPYPRNWSDELLQSNPPLFYQHLGVYAYRRNFLLSLKTFPQSELEKTESLEQLRVLNEGYSIMVGVVKESSFGIDTQEDYQRFVERRKQTETSSF